MPIFIGIPESSAVFGEWQKPQVGRTLSPPYRLKSPYYSAFPEAGCFSAHIPAHTSNRPERLQLRDGQWP